MLCAVLCNASRCRHMRLCDVLQGASVAYAMLSTLPEMNEKISVVIQMGPVAFIEFFRAPFLANAANRRNDDVSGHHLCSTA